MKVKQDLKDCLENNLDRLIEDHFEIWKDRYYRMTRDGVLRDLKDNYDFSGDLEYISDCLARELTLSEQAYCISKFETRAFQTFYKKD